MSETVTLTIDGTEVTVPKGTTIIQVTHSERNATFGNRIIQLKDGWVVSEEKAATSVGP